MTKITQATKQAVRSEAERFLGEHGFTAPPLPPEDALSARKLEVTQLSLDDLLIKANLTPEDKNKVQAVINIKDRAITFRDGLPPIKRNWGSLHEVGHEFLPWHKQLLYYCPFLMLPAHIQNELEAEADIFAAEAFYFGTKFMELVKEGEFGLVTAKELVDNIFKTSYHAAFIRLVEESDIPCCLLVWKPAEDEDTNLIIPSSLVLHYYVKSNNFHGHFRTKQTTEDEVLINLFGDPSKGVVKHEIEFGSKKTTLWIAKAESFCNVYNVFTLVSQPKLESVYSVKT